MNNISCDIITDLLPLYHDGVCNEASKKLVEDHLTACPTCAAMLAKLKDNTLDTRLTAERQDVVSHHTRAVKRKSLIVGISIGGVLLIPVLITMIVNLAVGQALDWFFIVLTALMLTASFTVVPLVIEKNRGLWTLGSFTGCLLLMLLTIRIYHGGDWFLMAAIPIIFAFTIIFGPYLLHKVPLIGWPARHKGFLAMAANTILLYAVIITSGIYTQAGPGFWGQSFSIAAISLLLPWSMFLTIRYLKANALTKTGLCFILFSTFTSIIQVATDRIITGTWENRFADANLLVWNGGITITNANVHLLVLLTGWVVGGILVAIGIVRKKQSLHHN